MAGTPETCDLCRSQTLERLYEPRESTRGLAVHLCTHCGLVQSLPRRDSIPDTAVTVTAGAGWGNVRYGKAFRTDAAVSFLSQRLQLTKVRRCLDVGSSRGSFVTKLREIAPQVEIVAVEPDARVVDKYRSEPGIHLHVDRIENIDLPPQYFDLVYCSHTLEHVRSPAATLRQIRASLAPGAALFIEVPNIEFIGRHDIVEEWFIDKHLYHYSPVTFETTLQDAGVQPIDDGRVDGENLTAIAVAVEPVLAAATQSRAKEVERMRRLVAGYRATLARNLADLQAAAVAIQTMARAKRVVVWGAGRIFDSLVRHGGLDPRQLAGVVDTYLAPLVSEVHGCQVRVPAAVASLQPEVVVIASRTYADEIRRQVHSLVPDCQVMRFDVLLTQAVERARPAYRSV